MNDENYGFIYITTNHINGKKYIGKKKHDSHENTYLGSGTAIMAAIEKYGKENFSKEIIEECKTKQELAEREKYWISYYHAVEDRMYYNIASGGEGGGGHHFSSEERQELSERNKGSNNPYAKPVICLNDMKVFGSRSEAADYYNVREDSIVQAIKRKTNVYSPNKDKLVFEDYIEGKEYQFHENARKTRNDARKVICITTGEVFESANEASIKYGLDRNRIYEALKNNNHGVKGYLFRYYNQNEEYNTGKVSSKNIPIYCITNGKHYSTLKEVMIDCHVSRRTIHDICRGLINKSKNGYVFKYDDVNLQ